jgi:uncharacterized protein (UPF0332 family)
MNLSVEKKLSLIAYNIEKAETAINDTHFLIENKKSYLAYNRIYYACFYIITALALKNDFSTSKHKQLIGWFNKNYVKENIVDKKYGKILNKAFDQRTESDYGTVLNPSVEEVLSLLEEVKEFVHVIKHLLTK